MRHEAVFYIAIRAVNKFMSHLDLCEKGKVYVQAQEVSFSTDTKVDEEYFAKIIAESKKEKEMWIPAISYMNNFFVDAEINAISDGKHELFIREKE